MVINNRIEISKDIYLWAIRESQIDFAEIKSRFEKIEAWIAGKTFPTFRQLEQLANFLKVPLGCMFLNIPPEKNIIETEFRTIGNKMPKISKNLEDTLYFIGRKRDWLSEYRREKGWSKLFLDDFGVLDVNNVFKAKKFLDLDEFWYKKKQNKALAFKYLRRKLEDKGIVVMQSGVVGSNNHRKLNVKEFRGFLLYDDVAPFIFINALDSLAGKIFTLIHEYIHFLLRKDDIFVDEGSDEQNINRITAEFLIPTSHLRELWDESGPKLKQIEILSRLFHVSELVMAIKLKDLGYIPQHLINVVKRQMEINLKTQDKIGSGKGNYYYTGRSRFGENFLGAVIQGVESGALSYTYAFNLLDGSAKLFDYFQEEFMGYEGQICY